MSTINRVGSSSSFLSAILILMISLFLSVLISLPTFVASRRIYTPTNFNEEFTVIATLIENQMLDASECFKYYFKVPQIMNVSAQPEWYVATAHISSYQYGRVGVCDRCLKVRTMDSRHQVIAKVIGNCPTCLPDQIELSPKSFYQLGIDRNRTSGWDKIRTLGAVYSFVECPIVMEGTFWPYIPPQVAD